MWEVDFVCEGAIKVKDNVVVAAVSALRLAAVGHFLYSHITV